MNVASWSREAGARRPQALALQDPAFAITGRMIGADTSVQNNLHGWYDPHAGRWISEDPIGFAAGDANLYRYVGNGVTGASDPRGLIDNDRQWDILRSQIPPPRDPVPRPPRAIVARALIQSTLQGIHDEHRGTFYFEASGLHKFLATRGNSTGHIKRFVSRPTSEVALGGAYHAGDDERRIVVLNGQRLNMSAATTVHEMVHVVDDMNGWYLPTYYGSTRSAEGLAFAAETLVSLLPQLKNFDRDLRGEMDKDGIIWGNNEAEMQNRWDTIWTRFGPSSYTVDVHYLNYRGKSTTEKLNPSDPLDLRTQFGFSLSAKTLTAEANKILQRRRCTYRLKVPKGVAEGFK